MDGWNRLSVTLLQVYLVIGAVGGAGGLLLYALLSPPSLPLSGGQGAEVAVAVDVGSPIAQPPLALEVDGSEDPGRSILRAELRRGKEGTLRVRTTSWGLYLLSKVDWLLGIPSGVWIFWSLYSFLRAVLEGTPFDAANSRRLRVVGLLLIGIPLVQQVAETSLAWTMLGPVSTDGLSYERGLVNLPYEGLFTGLVFLAFASIFRYGARLEEERSLTV